MLLKNIFKQLTITLAASSILFSCDSNSEPIPDGGNGYYPLAIGKYKVYDVDSLYWDEELGEEVPLHWQHRYDIVDTFRNEDNQLTYTINILKRKANTMPFILDDVMHVTPMNERIELKHQNLHFVAFKFPVNETTKWDALLYMHDNPDLLSTHPIFKSEKWDYHYENINAPYKNELFHFDHTATLFQIDEMVGDPSTDTTISAHRYFGKEIYAQGVGMIYKEFVNWTFDPLPPNGTGTGKKNGNSVIMKIVDYN